MTLRKEVLQRLLLAKSILSQARTAPRGQLNEHSVAKQVLDAHDAADLVFAAIADQQNKLPSKGRSPSMVEYLDLISSTAEKHTGYFKQLNDVRIGLKHTGLLPNTNQWGSVADDVFEKLSGICGATLDIPLADIDESELLVSNEAKVYLASAKAAKASGNFKGALEEIAKALYVSLSDAQGMERIIVGQANAEDALKLTAFGVSANEFLRLQEFLPKIYLLDSEPEVSEPGQLLWKQSEYGHPGNWREEVIDFCINAYVNVALALQSIPAVPHAIRFDVLYEYKITAKEDNVEVWEDLVEGHLSEIGHDPAIRSFRIFKRYLVKGEMITMPGHTPSFVSDDFSLTGASIKRVRVSHDPMRVFFGESQRAEFVDFAQVQIMCVSPDYIRGHVAFDVPEVLFEEDPE